MQKKKLYIILGGGIKKNGNLPDHVLSRIDLVSELAKKNEYVIASSSFSLNLPPKLDKEGYVIYESVKIAQELKNRGFKNIVTENWSHDTIGSSLFCRMLIDSLQLDTSSMFVITSDFHYKRTLEVFSWAFNILKPVHKPIKVLFTESSQKYKKDIDQRLIKEEEAIGEFVANFKNIDTFRDGLKQLLTTHDNYNLKHISSNRNASKISMY